MLPKQTNSFITDFFLCGLCGWCMECFWTGMDSIRQKQDKTLLCHTSIWMFPIYGLAAFFSPLIRLIKKFAMPIRGAIYAICIFTAEFLTGSLLKKCNACPWDYSKAKLNYKGLIRFDYAPAWAVAGLIFEKLLTSNHKTLN